MNRRIVLIGLTGIALVIGGAIGWQALRAERPDQPTTVRPPPVAVSAAEAREVTWRPTLGAVGTLRAVQGVDVTSEVSGIAQKITFDSGQEVEAGDLLVQLDDAVDQAQLQELLAQQSLAAVTLRRQKRLGQEDFASEARVDQARSEFEQAQARVGRQRELISDKAIRAPFDGHLGIRQVDLGQYISPGTAIVTLQSLDPIFVDFFLPQENLRDVRVGQRVEVTVNTYPDRKFVGEVTAINPKVDQATRNFAIQATLQNDATRLRPGMFVDVEVVLPEQRQVLTLPDTAVSYNPYGDFVFVVRRSGSEQAGEPALVAERRFVTTGGQRGARVAITKGLSAGDLVVTAGQLKLQDGAPVRVDNDVRPVADPTPAPDEP